MVSHFLRGPHRVDNIGYVDNSPGKFNYGATKFRNLSWIDNLECRLWSEIRMIQRQRCMLSYLTDVSHLWHSVIKSLSHLLYLLWWCNVVRTASMRPGACAHTHWRVTLVTFSRQVTVTLAVFTPSAADTVSTVASLSADSARAVFQWARNFKLHCSEVYIVKTGVLNTREVTGCHEFRAKRISKSVQKYQYKKTQANVIQKS